MARVTLNNCVKFKGLIKRLALPRPYVRGLLETMWDVANECGNPIIGRDEDIEIACEWPGEPGALFVAMKDGRWIDPLEDGRWSIHDYWDHAPAYVKDRLRKEEERKNKNLGAKRPGHSGTNPGKSSTPTLALAPAPTPAPKECPTDTCTEPPAAAVPHPVLMFPVSHRTGEPEEWPLSTAYIDELGGIFQGVDVNAESRKALGWVRASAGRKKTARGMKKFLFGWMERTQGRGSRLAGTSGPNGDDAAGVGEQKRMEIARRITGGKS